MDEFESVELPSHEKARAELPEKIVNRDAKPPLFKPDHPFREIVIDELGVPPFQGCEAFIDGGFVVCSSQNCHLVKLRKVNGGLPANLRFGAASRFARVCRDEDFHCWERKCASSPSSAGRPSI